MIDLHKIQRILFIKLRHIGDVLLAAGVFKAVKQANPLIHISVVVPVGTEEMLSLNPSVDEVLPLQRNHSLRHQLAFLFRIRGSRPDVAVNMTEGDRGAFLAAVSGARWRIGIDPKKRGFLGKRHLFTHLVESPYNGRHRAVMDMDVLRPLGIESDWPEVELFTSPEDDGIVASLLREQGLKASHPYIVIHPTSRWLFKCWRDEAVAGLVDRMEGTGWKVVLTCGPDDKEQTRFSNILSCVRSKPLLFPGNLTLKRLASLIKGASLFFGVDSAPMHMAAALSIPVVALFGPSDHRVWHPLTPRGRIIVKTREFDCIPCKQDGCNGSKKSACLDAVSVDEVYHAVRDTLGA